MGKKIRRIKNRRKNRRKKEKKEINRRKKETKKKQRRKKEKKKIKKNDLIDQNILMSEDCKTELDITGNGNKIGIIESKIKKCFIVFSKTGQGQINFLKKNNKKSTSRRVLKEVGFALEKVNLPWELMNVIVCGITDWLLGDAFRGWPASGLISGGLVQALRGGPGLSPAGWGNRDTFGSGDWSGRVGGDELGWWPAAPASRSGLGLSWLGPASGGGARFCSGPCNFGYGAVFEDPGREESPGATGGPVLWPGIIFQNNIHVLLPVCRYPVKIEIVWASIIWDVQLKEEGKKASLTSTSARLVISMGRRRLVAVQFRLDRLLVPGLIERLDIWRWRLGHGRCWRGRQRRRGQWTAGSRRRGIPIGIQTRRDHCGRSGDRRRGPVHGAAFALPIVVGRAAATAGVAVCRAPDVLMRGCGTASVALLKISLLLLLLLLWLVGHVVASLVLVHGASRIAVAVALLGSRRRRLRRRLIGLAPWSRTGGNSSFLRDSTDGKSIQRPSKSQFWKKNFDGKSSDFHQSINQSINQSIKLINQLINPLQSIQSINQLTEHHLTNQR